MSDDADFFAEHAREMRAVANNLKLATIALVVEVVALVAVLVFAARA